MGEEKKKEFQWKHKPYTPKVSKEQENEWTIPKKISHRQTV